MKLGEYESKPDVMTTWALRVSVTIAFLAAGTDKFSDSWIEPFDLIGLGQWFRYFTGIVEITGGLLFLIPPATSLGAAMLIVTMLGAMATQILIFRHPLDSLFPGLYLAGVSAAFFKLRSDRRLVGRESRRLSS